MKALEEHGIGRPSTYATIISTLQDREYVEMDNRRFIPTDIGKIVNRFLTQHFHRYVEYGFTAAMEDELDAVSRGEEEWTTPLEKFWKPFIDAGREDREERHRASRSRWRASSARTRRPASRSACAWAATARSCRSAPRTTKRSRSSPACARPEDGHVTLADALELFKLPRTLGETADGETIVANVGRFGPYVKYGAKYVSLKEDDPYTITLERALEVIRLKQEADANRIIPDFPEARHPGAERPLRSVHHGREEERQDPEGSRPEVR